MKRTIKHGDELLSYELEYKKVKNLNMRVGRTGEVHVSAPFGVSCDFIDKFVTDKINFIHRARERIEKKAESTEDFSDVACGCVHTVLGKRMTLTVLSAQRSQVEFSGDKIIMSVKGEDTERKRQRLLAFAVSELFLKEARKIAARIYPLFSPLGIGFPEIKLKNVRSRWGSCHTKKHIITLSTMLISKPERLVEYVLMHEFCHFIYADHSKNFHREMTLRMPDWKQRRKELRQ